MGLIIISLILGGIAFHIICRTSRTILIDIACLLFVAALFGIFAGMLFPSGEYYPREEVKTTPLRDLISNEIFVEGKCDNYSVSVIEEEDCDYPRVVEYRQFAKPSFWFFGLGTRKETIIFYIPKNSLIN